MGIDKGQLGPVPNWFASFLFHINQTNISWDTAISNLTLKCKVKVKSEVKGQSYIIDLVSN